MVFCGSLRLVVGLHGAEAGIAVFVLWRLRFELLVRVEPRRIVGLHRGKAGLSAAMHRRVGLFCLSRNALDVSSMALWPTISVVDDRLFCLSRQALGAGRMAVWPPISAVEGRLLAVDRSSMAPVTLNSCGSPPGEVVLVRVPVAIALVRRWRRRRGIGWVEVGDAS